MRPETERPESRDGGSQETRTRHGGQQARTRREETGPRQGLGIQIQVDRESGHRPAGANLTCSTSPDLKCDAGVQSVEDDLGRSDVAFARNGFAERAQNGQRVGVRSPVGAPDNWGVRDVLAKKGGQVGAIMLKFGLDPWTGCSQHQPRRRAGSRWRHPVQCRHCPRPR